jgi:excisionase family DNA binding protein
MTDGTAVEISMLTPEQAAARLGTSIRFVRRLVAERRIPFFHIGKHLRFLSTDVDEFIAAGRVDVVAMNPPSRR